MKEVSINNQAKLSPHFSLGELTKTKFKTEDGNIPSHVAIENLRRICEDWLEELRYRYNVLYGAENGGKQCGTTREGQAPSDVGDDHSGASPCVSPEEPIIINHGYRSPQVSKAMAKAGYKPSSTSNHLTGCAVDIRCLGKEQALRYAAILLDIADGTKQDFDELFIEWNARGSIWLHFAVRPQNNRRKIAFMAG